MKHGLICKLTLKDGQTILQLFDAENSGSTYHVDEIFTVLPESIEKAINNKDLMAQLGESILIRLAVANGIEL